MATIVITDKDGNIINRDDATVPTDRHFRNAWSLSGTVISEDMTEAKNIFKGKIREVREPLLTTEDANYMKALESNDSDQKVSIATKKTNLRDAPAAAAITNATTITDLKAAWDSDLLGASPYAQDKL